MLGSTAVVGHSIVSCMIDGSQSVAVCDDVVCLQAISEGSDA